MGKKERNVYTESGLNLFPRAFPPMPFSKRNVLATRIGVIAVEVSFTLLYEKYFILVIEIFSLNLNMSLVLQKLVRLKSTRMFSSTLYSRFAPPVARNLKKLDTKGSRRIR